MLLITAIFGVFAAITLSSAQSTACPSNSTFRLKASAVDGPDNYLTPGYPCTTTYKGCGAFFSVNSSTGYTYTIPDGTTNLVIATAPTDAKTPAGLYAGALHGQHVISVKFSKKLPKSFECSVEPKTTGDGCMLACTGKQGFRMTSGSSIDTSSSNQWLLGKHSYSTKSIIEVVYT